jgi:site-specific DNA-methyltransferase (cytosine-N4-specific)
MKSNVNGLGQKLTRCSENSNFRIIKSKRPKKSKLMNDRRKTVRIAYRTARGVFFQGQAEDVLTSPLAAKYRGKVDLIFTSPPFPLNRKKKYGNLQGEKYINWLKGLALTFRALLKRKGSIVMEMGNSWEKGKPVMSTLALKALLAFLESGKFHLCQQFIWNNPARLPSPAQWVNIERIRVKDAYTHLWWMSPTERPKADNRRVLNGYSDSMKKLLATKKYNAGKRPSEHHIGKKSFLTNNRGAIPSNVITLANTQASSDYLDYCRKKNLEPHPARMPIGLPEFFIKFLTDRGGLVLDPFGGSNTTGAAAENLHRKWLAIEPRKHYIRASRGRFKRILGRRKANRRRTKTQK